MPDHDKREALVTGGNQVSAQPPAKKTAGLIEKETLVMKFHTSTASGLKSGQSDHQETLTLHRNTESSIFKAIRTR
ncbi:MAG: hypothetical protein V3V39_06200 [Desulfobacterales bacterium]